jgi:inorganic phosphate transporter, PiT family
MAAVFNLFGAFIGTKIAGTVGSGLIDPPSGIVGLIIVGSALIGARQHPGRTTRGFRYAQTLSAAAMALGHGLQDAGKIMGVGATKRLSAVRWGVAKNIVTGWVLTFPGAGLVAALVYAATIPFQ